MKKSLLLLLTLSLAAAPGLLAADHTGRFAAGTKYEAPPAHAPASVSRMFVRSLERGAGAVELPASGDSGMIIWAIPARTAPGNAKIATRLRTPDGAVLDTADRGSAARGVQRFVLEAAETEALGIGAGGAHEVVHIEQAAAATYELEVEMPDDVAGVLVVAAEPDSALTMSTWAAPLSRQPGQPVTLHAELRRGDAAVEGATVVARLASPHGKTFAPIALTDRGNGVYEATLAELPEIASGSWQVRFEATGAANGAAFARNGHGELFAERGAATLSSLHTEVVGDMLRVRVDADMRFAGNYRLDVLVADRDGNALSWGEGARRLDAGPGTLTMEVPLGTAGEDLFVDVRLLSLDAPGVAGRITN